MTNTILMIVAIVIGIIIAVKFIRFLIKGIIFLALVAIVVMIFTNMTHGTILPSKTTTKMQTLAQNESGKVAQKLKGFNLKQVEANLQHTLTKSMNSVKQ